MSVVKLKRGKPEKLAADPASPPVTRVVISPPNFKEAKLRIIGTAPYVSNNMSGRIIDEIRRKQEEGSTSKKGRKLPPKDFDLLYKEMMHYAKDGGWIGMPASAFRSAMVSACRTVGYAMTRAKLAVFVIPDGFSTTGQPLVKIKGTPRRRDMAVRLADGGTTVLPRPFFDEWSAEVTLSWDNDMFTAQDVVNLMARVGLQVGIGAGRPDSKSSTGMGWGTFKVDV